MARRILNRKDLRADYDAAERRKLDGEEHDETEDEVEDGAAEEEEATGQEGAEEVEEEEKPAKKAKAPAKPRASRSRASKTARMKVVWCVFSNSNQKVATFDYPKRKDADELAAKLTADKKSTHFVQPVKEPIEEKK
ncbi:MAG: hypothetical protein JO112_10710 [Planctomycetes bacterium]|nr:hypothetical protein [Planctomycetota bacterium]